VTQAEVDLCLIRTYLFAGDLMTLREGTSAALQPIELDAHAARVPADAGYPS
jgi:hypothetical protein